MLTSLKHYYCFYSSYDLSQSKEEFITKEIAQHREVAKAYFATKPRTTYLYITGEGYSDESKFVECDEVCYAIPFTDEEIQNMRKQWIDEYNKDGEDVLSYDDDITFEELNDAIPADEINDDITKMLYDKTDGLITCIRKVGRVHNTYFRFAASFYDEETQTQHKPITFSIELTDEEYIEILTQRLFVPKQFCYNRLVLTHPHIAQRISEHIHDWHFHNPLNDKLYSCLPFIVHFTEIEEDAKAIEAEQEGDKE